MAEEQKPSDESPPSPPSPPSPAPRTRPNVWVAVAVVLVAAGFLALNLRHRTGAQGPRASSGQASRGGITGRSTPPRVGGGDGGGGDGSVVDSVPRAEAQAGSPALAIFAPLRVGATLGNGTVEHITEVIDGRILVTFRIGDEVGTYGIMLYTPEASDLLHAGRYVIYVHGTPSPALNALGNNLVEVLSRHQSLPVPPGLRAIDLSRH